MGDIDGLLALAYFTAAPFVGAVLGWVLARSRFLGRLDEAKTRLSEANERAHFLRAVSEDYGKRLAGYQQRETRITWPDFGPALGEKARNAFTTRGGRR